MTAAAARARRSPARTATPPARPRRRTTSTSHRRHGSGDLPPERRPARQKAEVGFIDNNQDNDARRLATACLYRGPSARACSSSSGEQKAFRTGILVRKAQFHRRHRHLERFRSWPSRSRTDQAAYGQDPQPQQLRHQPTRCSSVHDRERRRRLHLTFDLEPARRDMLPPPGAHVQRRGEKAPIHGRTVVWTIDANWGLLQMDTDEATPCPYRPRQASTARARSPRCSRTSAP